MDHAGRSERLRTTPSYAETRAFIDRLVASAPRLLRIETFGRSSEGRELYAVIASRGDGRRRPAVLAQAGIHAGEIDGKDAGLMLLRDIAQRGRADLLDRADLVFVPIFNVDGHERSSRFSRPNQRGPQEQGWRTTARNLNLNRDYLKADTPEMQAMLGLLRRVDPALYLDIHVTDGVDYQYDITYGFLGRDGRYAQSAAIGRWLDRRLRPAMTRRSPARATFRGRSSSPSTTATRAPASRTHRSAAASARAMAIWRASPPCWSRITASSPTVSACSAPMF
jgi:murein tripeptide amidase MpaA